MSFTAGPSVGRVSPVPTSISAAGVRLMSWNPRQEVVEAHQCLGVVADPFGEREAEVHTPTSGIVIGRINLPLVNEGEPLFHIARLEPGAEAGAEALTTLIRDLEEARATEIPAEPPLG
jgi:hypothetical protein